MLLKTQNEYMQKISKFTCKFHNAVNLHLITGIVIHQPTNHKLACTYLYSRVLLYLVNFG